jgi:hypothetical protein
MSPSAAPAGQTPLQIAPEPPAEGEPFGRIVAFLAIVAVAALWLQHHLGFEFEKLGVIAIATAAWGVMGKVADWVGEKSAMGRFIDAWFKTPLRVVLRYMTRPAQLYGTAVLVGVLMATVSSVTVRSSAPGERAAVSLASLDSRRTPRTDTLTRDKAAVRFLPILTSPFGRIYEVDADGYVPTQVTVYPLVSRQVILGRDLAAAPSVLFRPFDEGVVALEDSADFQVSRLRDGQWERLAEYHAGGVASSFLIGARKPISDAAMVVWALEAAANGAPEMARSKLLVTWRTPKSVPIRVELHPRDCLLAEIRLHGNLKERAVVPLSNDPLIDVLMQAVTTDSTKVPTC